MATHICTHCLYEGKPVNPPNDDETGDGGVGKAAMRIAKSPLALGPFAIFIPLFAYPIAGVLWLLLWPFKRAAGIGGKRHCPHCGLPLMVSLKSDKGWLAKRKLDIQIGAVVVEKKKEEVVAFGRELKLPETNIVKSGADEPFDDFEMAAPKLPAVENILSVVDEPEPSQKASAPEPEPAAVQQKKTDPDAW